MTFRLTLLPFAARLLAAPEPVSIGAAASPGALPLIAAGRAVADHMWRSVSHHQTKTAGAHRIRLWAVDPGVVIQRLILSRASYTTGLPGPGESTQTKPSPANGGEGFRKSGRSEMKLWIIFPAVALALPAAAASTDHWIATWGAAQQVPEPNNLLPSADLQDATVRQVVHLSAGGTRLRIRFSNAFGTEALLIDAAHIARSADKATARAVVGTDRALTFDGRPTVSIPPGADYLSDPVALDAPALSSLTVSIHLPQAPAGQTGHPGARATSYTLHGDHTADPDLPVAAKVDHWYQLTGVEVAAPAAAATIVAFGDSITDGHGATTNGDDRWPDILAARLQAAPATRRLSVVNVGIGGNHLLTDGLGPNALARLDRDALARPGARVMLLLEAINDLGKLSREAERTPAQHAQLVADLIAAYRQIVARAHAQGVRVIGCTITPYVGSDYYHPDAASEADRQALNRWIRSSGGFDGVVDFDAAVRDPARPDRMIAAYDSGDHLHPSAAGYKVMADAIPLALLR